MGPLGNPPAKCAVFLVVFHYCGESYMVIWGTTILDKPNIQWSKQDILSHADLQHSLNLNAHSSFKMVGYTSHHLIQLPNVFGIESVWNSDSKTSRAKVVESFQNSQWLFRLMKHCSQHRKRWDDMSSLEVQPPFFIGWFSNHHYFSRGLSSSKRNHHFLSAGGSMFHRSNGGGRVMILNNSTRRKRTTVC